MTVLFWHEQIANVVTLTGNESRDTERLYDKAGALRYNSGGTNHSDMYVFVAGGKGKGRALGVKELKFKGQVRPYHDKITYSIDIRKFITKPTFMAWGDAVLTVQDKAIYFAKDLQVGLFDKLVWDNGMDPALDPF